MPYVTKAELRALPNLADTTRYPDAKLDAAIEWFETTFENYVGMAFVPREGVTYRTSGGSASLRLPHPHVTAVTAVTVYNTATSTTAFTEDELDDIVVDSSGIIARFSNAWFPAGSRNILVTYTHGLTEPPADVKEAALVAIRDKLLTDTVGNRQFSVQTEVGIVRQSTPGPDSPFGLPFVDEVARRRRIPVMA